MRREKGCALFDAYVEKGWKNFCPCPAPNCNTNKMSHLVFRSEKKENYFEFSCFPDGSIDYSTNAFLPISLNVNSDKACSLRRSITRHFVEALTTVTNPNANVLRVQEEHYEHLPAFLRDCISVDEIKKEYQELNEKVQMIAQRMDGNV